MIVSHGIDSSMVHRRQCSFWESSRFDCSEAACRIRLFGVDSGNWTASGDNRPEAGAGHPNMIAIYLPLAV